MRADSRFVTLPPDAGDYQGEDGADKDQSGIQACIEQLAELAA